MSSSLTPNWYKTEIENTQRRARRRLEFHRVSIQKALARTGVTTAEYSYDGCGDQGDMDSATYFIDGSETTVPSTLRALKVESWADNDPLPRVQYAPLETVEAELVFDALEVAGHMGWEINDGSCGSVDLDMRTRKVTVNYQYRYTTLSDEAVTMIDG